LFQPLTIRGQTFQNRLGVCLVFLLLFPHVSDSSVSSETMYSH
jgi:hypothetical protein